MVYYIGLQFTFNFLLLFNFFVFFIQILIKKKLNKKNRFYHGLYICKKKAII
jgi:hypothetical protein